MLDHYEAMSDAGRLDLAFGPLERARTREIALRYLPPAPAVVIDVGGGGGDYALWLARQGYEAHLVDPVARHIDDARSAATAQPRYPLASASLGDARRLDFPDASVDAALLLGPLYHLTARAARVAALREVRRTLRPGGVVVAAVISRFASTLDGLVRNLFDDPRFVDIVARDLRDGQHRNPTDDRLYFTTAYFHLPGEVEEEMTDAGFKHEGTFAVEGPGWLLQNFTEHWEDHGRRERLLAAVRSVESEPSMLGASAHILAVARRSE
jgi:ubiquinone/menaquinone biosynthesis C-methylase UbiE